MKISLVVILSTFVSIVHHAHAQVGIVTGFRLLSAPSGTVIQTLVDGSIIYLNNTLPGMTIEAITDKRRGRIRSVQMGLNANTNLRIEQGDPYTLCGGFAACPELIAGKHTVVARPRRLIRQGSAKQLSFELVAGFAPGTGPVAPSVATPPSSPSAPVVASGPTPTAPKAAGPAPTAPMAAIAPMAIAPMVAPKAPLSAPVATPDPPKAAPTVIAPLATPPLQPSAPKAAAPVLPPMVAAPVVVPTAPKAAASPMAPVVAPVTPPAAAAPSGSSNTPISVFPFYISAAGVPYDGTDGTKWVADSIYATVNGTTAFIDSGSNISNTVEDGLYRKERYGAEVKYAIPVVNGNYQVITHHSEQFNQITAAGQRVFKIILEEGSPTNVTSSNIDIFGSTGAINAALKVTLPTVTVADGVLNLGFVAVTQNPQICGIEIKKV